MLKGAVMPKVAHHFQQLFQQGTGLRVEQVVGLAALVVFPRGSIGVPVAQPERYAAARAGGFVFFAGSADADRHRKGAGRSQRLFVML